MTTVRFEYQRRINDPSVTESFAFTGDNRDRNCVGGYIDCAMRGMSGVFLPWVEITVSITDCLTENEAKAQIESLSARMLSAIAEWEQEVKKGAQS